MYYRKVLEAAERSMVEWFMGDASPSRQRHAPAVGGALDNGKGDVAVSRKETTVDENRDEAADRVAMYQADYRSSR